MASLTEVETPGEEKVGRGSRRCWWLPFWICCVGGIYAVIHVEIFEGHFSPSVLTWKPACVIWSWHCYLRLQLPYDLKSRDLLCFTQGSRGSWIIWLLFWALRKVLLWLLLSKQLEHGCEMGSPPAPQSCGRGSCSCSCRMKACPAGELLFEQYFQPLAEYGSRDTWYL